MESIDHIIRGENTSQILAMAVSLLAAAFDLRTKRIPNALTFGAAGTAFLYAPVIHGFSGFLTSVGGWFAGCALFLPFFLLGGMGAGDVKLIAAIGAWLGPSGALWAALYAMIAGGIMAVLLALSTGYLRQALNNVGALLMHWRISGVRSFSPLTLAEGSGPRLPYAVPIAVGTIAAAWLR